MWVLFALGASLFWGLTYAINEQVYRHISFLTSLAISSVVIAVAFIAAAFFSGSITKDLPTLGSKSVLLLIAAEAITLVIAEVFIGLSITNKNATLAALIEISYPLFIALFAWLIFKESELSIGTAVGAVLIFLGVGSIYLFNR